MKPVDLETAQYRVCEAYDALLDCQSMNVEEILRQVLSDIAVRQYLLDDGVMLVNLAMLAREMATPEGTETGPAKTHRMILVVTYAQRLLGSPSGKDIHPPKIDNADGAYDPVSLKIIEVIQFAYDKHKMA